MSVWDELRNRITSNFSLAVRNPAQFGQGVKIGIQQQAPRFNIPAQLNATRQIATPVLKKGYQNYVDFNNKFKPTTMPVISAAKTAGSEYLKNIQNTAQIARNRPVTPWNVAKTMGAATLTGFNLPFNFITKDVENRVERTPLKFARVKTPAGVLSASGVAGFGAVIAMPTGSPAKFAKIAKFTDVNKIATELRGLKIAEKEIPALSKKLVNVKNIEEVTNVIKGHLAQATKGVEGVNIKGFTEATGLKGKQLESSWKDFQSYKSDAITSGEHFESWMKNRFSQPSGVEGVSKGGRLGRKLTQPADLATIKAKSLEQVVSEQLPTGGGQAGNPTVSSSSEIITDPVNKIIEALKGAKPLVGEQGKLYSAERAKRVARVVSVGKKLPGEAGFYAQLGQLKGQLPKVEFESIKKQFRQEDLNALYQKVEDYNLMQPFEKITAKTGLSKLLGAEGGSLPTSGELKLLGEIFPPEFVQAVLDNRSTTQKLFTNAVDALNIPRSLMTSFDYSAGLRQAIFAAPRHPIRFAQAFMGQFRQSFSEKIFQAGQQAIKENPNYLLARGRLALTDTGKFIGGREEAFASNLAEKIPLFGRVVKASERAYIGMLNKFRMDLFSDMVNNSKKLGVAIDEKFLDDAAGLINNMTGRGELPSKLKGAAPLLNGAFFSPRLMASRLNLLNPTYYVGLSPVVRKEALQSLFTFTATGMTVLGLAKLAGASVGADPRSADFGKVKYGNTRYDIWGGFQQYPRMAGQLLSGKLVSTTSGKITTLGEGYKPLNRFDILQRFFESKTAPVPSFVLSLLKGQNNVGEPFNLPTEVVNRMIPMVIADMYDLAKEKGSPLGGLLATPGIFGVGVQTYGKQIPTRGKTAGGKPNIQYNAVPGLGEDIVNTITGKQVSNIPKEQWEPIVAKHNKDMMVDEIRTIQKQIQTGVIKKEDGMKRIQELMNKISSAVVKPVNASTGTSGGINVPMSKIARTPTVKLKQKKGKKVKLAKWRTIKAKSISFKAKKVKKPKITAYKLKKSLTGKA